MKKFLGLAVATATLVMSFSAYAGDYQAKAKALAAEKIQAWVNNPEIIDAIKAQNTKHASLSQSDIDALDKKWRAGDNALIGGILQNDLSKFLKDIHQKGAGLYTEIFIMDNKGLNVGQSDKTSDYWQGDEAKWKETYLKGAGAIHISDVEKDESSQTYQLQISLPIVDGEQVIGAATIGVNAEMLE